MFGQVSVPAESPSQPIDLAEGFIPVPGADLYYRAVGRGRPLIVLHGGPDFDHTYLLPDLDRLADSYRLIYYDQRGRGRSTGAVESVSVASEVDDLDRLREFFDLESIAVLGHSWGGLLALLYALRRPERVSHLILLNTAPATAAGILATRHERLRRSAADAEQLAALRDSPRFAAGDPAAVGGYWQQLYRSTAFHRPENAGRLDLSFPNSPAEGVRRAWAIEERLYVDTYALATFNLIPELGRLALPTLVVHGAADFVPLAEVEQIAGAIPGARLVVLAECGHFAYIEAPGGVRRALAQFFAAA